MLKPQHENDLHPYELTSAQRPSALSRGAGGRDPAGGGCRVAQSGDAVFAPKGFQRDAASRREGVRAWKIAISPPDIDTTWKFSEMIAFRDHTAARLGFELLVHVNEDGLRRGISPVASAANVHTQVMKTEALRQALEK